MRMWTKGVAMVAALTMVGFAGLGPGVSYAGTDTTSGDNSLLGGNQLKLPISVPINISGIAAAAGGIAAAASKGDASVRNEGDSGSGMTTSGNQSLGGGNQLDAPIRLPVTVCGNPLALLRTVRAHCARGPP